MKDVLICIVCCQSKVWQLYVLWAALKINKMSMHLEFLHCQEPSPSALCSSGSERSSSLSLLDKSDVALLLANTDACKLALSCISSFLPPFSRCLKKVPVRNANKQLILKVYLAIVWLWKRVAWAKFAIPWKDFYFKVKLWNILNYDI